MYQTGKLTSLISKHRLTRIVKVYYTPGNVVAKLNFTDSDGKDKLTNKQKEVAVRICKDCDHFRLNKIDNISPEDASKSSSYQKYQVEYGTCEMFGDINLITGKIRPEYALVARGNPSMCGHEGKYFSQKSSCLTVATSPDSHPSKDTANHKNKGKECKKDSHRNKKYDDGPLS